MWSEDGELRPRGRRARAARIQIHRQLLVSTCFCCYDGSGADVRGRIAERGQGGHGHLASMWDAQQDVAVSETFTNVRTRPRCVITVFAADKKLESRTRCSAACWRSRCGTAERGEWERRVRCSRYPTLRSVPCSVLTIPWSVPLRMSGAGVTKLTHSSLSASRFANDDTSSEVRWCPVHVESRGVPRSKPEATIALHVGRALALRCRARRSGWRSNSDAR